MGYSIEELGPRALSPGRYGGKAAALSHLINLGHRVPPGVVIPVDGFADMLRAHRLTSSVAVLAASLKRGEPDLGVASDIQQVIMEGELPQALAAAVDEATAALWEGNHHGVMARSSATVEDSSTRSFAGIFESMAAERTEDLHGAIRSVWASAFSPRVMSYSTVSGITELPEMAVVIQRLIPADRSGVMFTTFDHRDGTHRTLVEHVAGMGERLVKGELTPQRMWLPGGHESGDEPLAERHETDLGLLARLLEEQFEGPQDVEWCLWNDDLYVIQTRPVTAVSKAPSPDLSSHTALLQGVGASSGVGVGAAHLVFNVDQAMAIRSGEVLVTPMTNPDMVVAMRTSSAVVTDVGGMICHAAIVSRELGLPCVVGTETATRSLSEGQVITVDGGTGRVFDGEVSAVTSQQPRATARDLWSVWKAASSDSDSVLPMVGSIEFLRVAPADVHRLALNVDHDMRAGQSGLWNEFDHDSRGFAATVDSYLNDVADARAGLHVLVTSSNPDWLAVLKAAVGGRSQPGIDVLDATTSTASVARALAPTTVARRELPPVAAAIERMTDPRKVFGHQPEIRRAPMPNPDKRSAWWDRLPEYGRYQREFNTPADGGEHDWIDVRPEIVITPLLKSLVQPGFEMVPRVLGFNGLPPLQAKWIRGRFHFRGDTFAPLWASLVTATWDRAFMADLMSRVRLSYDRLAEVSSLFPPDDQLADLTPQQMTALITSWWPRWVEFFALNQFIQAQGDDVIYPFIDETLAAHQADLEASGHSLRWPAAIDFVAPTTPVMSADFMTSIDGVRTALHKAGLSTTQDALRAIEAGEDHHLAEKVTEHLRDWHWMRDRDLLFEPWDTPDKVIETALNSESHSGIDYGTNLRHNRWSTALHVELATAAGRSDALHHAIRFLQDLNMERENHHILWLKYSYPLRRMVVEIERRLSPGLAPNDVFFLQAPELLEATAALPDPLPSDLVELVRNRRRAYMHETKLSEVDASSLATEDDYF